MSRLIVNTFLSLDGVMQAPGGPDEDRSGGFDQGGWIVPYADEDSGRFVDDWIAEADGFLLGRKTYEIFAAYWPRVPNADNPVAAALNERPKYVVSKTLDRVEWNNSTLIKGNVVEEITRLKRRPGREIQVHGSGQPRSNAHQERSHRRVSTVVLSGCPGQWQTTVRIRKHPDSPSSC